MVLIAPYMVHIWSIYGMFETGELVAFIGSQCGGKGTVLKILGGRVSPTFRDGAPAKIAIYGQICHIYGQIWSIYGQI